MQFCFSKNGGEENRRSIDRTFETCRDQKSPASKDAGLLSFHCFRHGVDVAVGVGVSVSVSVGVRVGVSVPVSVGVAVTVAVGVLVLVGLGVLVGVGVAVAVGVFVGVAVGCGSVGASGLDCDFVQANGSASVTAPNTNSRKVFFMISSFSSKEQITADA
ncbi:hypothetical protein KGQ74_03335 [Patescibacteria group bacterium]|nr:hypothetical protein [Patescibacteria group bacterium]